MTVDSTQTVVLDGRTYPWFKIHVAIDDLGLDPYQFRVYARLCRRAAKSGECWEGLIKMADQIKMSRRQLIYVLKSLETWELISVVRQQGSTSSITVLSPYDDHGNLKPDPCTTCTTPVHHVHHPRAQPAPPSKPLEKNTKKEEKRRLPVAPKVQGSKTLPERLKPPGSPESKPAAILPNKQQTDGSAVWDAYEKAIEFRYRCKPTRDAQKNSICASLVKKVGKEAAIELVQHFVSHSSQYYVSRAHDLRSALNDCHKLQVELATGKRITNCDAREAERTQHNEQSGKIVLAEIEEGGFSGGSFAEIFGTKGDEKCIPPSKLRNSLLR